MDEAQVQKIAHFHRKNLEQNPNHTQKLTAEEFKLTEKQVCMILVIFEYLSHEDVKSKLGIGGAYAAALKHRKEQKLKALERLLQ